jgi:dTDP-4-dehydrorhamnose reductase
VGSPTFAGDLAAAIVGFVASRPRSGTFHVVNGGRASRSEWAREVLRLASIEVPLLEIPSAEWPRASRPPLWAVLEHSTDFGSPLRDWRPALATYMTGGPTAAVRTA